jgi:hypothetical protein
MARWSLGILISLVVMLISDTSPAGQPHPNDPADVLFRVNAPVRIAPGESAGIVWVINHDAIVEGTIRQQLIVMNGTAKIDGMVGDTVIVMNGTAELSPSARVGGDVVLLRSRLAQAPGAIVGGGIRETSGGVWRWGPIGFFWLSMTIFVIVSGLVFAAVAGRSLSVAAGLLRSKPGGALVTALAVWIGLPLLALIAFVTVIGIPVGFVIMTFLLPALWFIGYLVSGAGLGALLTRARRSLEEHPYGAVALGLLILQIAALIPRAGGAIVFIAGFLGAGALLYGSFRAWKISRGAPPAIA